MSLIIESSYNLLENTELGEKNKLNTVFSVNGQHIEKISLTTACYFMFESVETPSESQKTFAVISGELYVKSDNKDYLFTKGMSFHISVERDPVILFTDPKIGAEFLLISTEPNSAFAEEFMEFSTTVLTGFKEKDPESHDHSKRVMESAFRLGLALNLTPRELYRLRLAALFHDIGKIFIDHTILHSSSRHLSKLNKEVLEGHSSSGSFLFNNKLCYDGDIVSEIINQHHERIDGKGYPLGLLGDQIRKEAKIINIVDTFDALTHNRSYSKAVNKEKAIKELLRVSGKQVDKEILEIFLEMEEGAPPPLIRDFLKL